MRIALVTSDGREALKQYQSKEPVFGTAPEALLQGFATCPEAEVHVISCLQAPVQSVEKIANNIWFHTIHVPKLGWLRTLYQGCIRATKKHLRRLQPDIVHGQGTERDCALDAVFSGFPNVLTIHGNMRLVSQFEKTWHARIAARLERFTIPRSNGVVCISNYTRNAVADLAKRTWLLPNAVDIGFFDIQPVTDATAPPTILCVGAIGPRKNQNAFIRALDPLAARTKIRLLFFGVVSENHPYGREFMNLIAQRPWCEHQGFVDREKIKWYFRKATAVVLPSLEDNCPMVVLEAMAAGVPVVAANVGGVPDLVSHEKNGLLCDPSDAGSMRDALETILTKPELARTLVANARSDARNRFHPSVVARQHLEIYREVLKAR